MKQLTRFLAIPVAAGALFYGTYFQAGEKHVNVVLDEQPLTATKKAETSYSDIVKKASPSVVNIFSTKIVKQRFHGDDFFDDPMFRRFFGDRFDHPQQREQKQRRQGLGSGVIVSADGYILTNNHVVGDADEIMVGLPDEKKEYEAKLIGTDPDTDIAVIKIEAEGLKAITVTNSDNLEVGDLVLAIGNPFGIGKTVTRGIVSALGRGVGLTNYENFIQTDAAINPGNSGGALIDANGRLIGINTAIVSRSGGSQGIGFAVPINLARSVMDSLLKHGKVVRGFLGVQLQPLTPELAETMGMEKANGALVSQVLEDGAAEEAGFKAGDVVIEFNGKPIDSGHTLQMEVARTAPDSKVKVTVLRDGKEKVLSVKLKERTGNEQANWSESEDIGELIDGVEVANLTTQRRELYEIPKKVTGVIVTNVDIENDMRNATLVPGDVITLFDGEKVTDTDKLMKLKHEAEGKRVLMRIWRKGMMMFIPLNLK